MVRVSCRDIGIEGCGFSCEGERAGKVEEMLFEHIRDRHPELIAGLDFKRYREFEHRVKSAIADRVEAARAQRAA
jgi:predicted small metal-binding protein